MIDALLKVLDKLIDLLKIRDAHFRARFEKIHKPMFESFKQVHEDYRSIFLDALNELESQDEGAVSKLTRFVRGQATLDHLRTRRAAALLRKRREEFAPIRAKLSTLSNYVDISSFRSDEQEFLNYVMSYFPSMDCMPLRAIHPGEMSGATPLTYFLGELQFESLVVRPDNYRLTGEFRRILADLERARESVEQAFDRLVLKVTNAA